jgi:hypothetical protein
MTCDYSWFDNVISEILGLDLSRNLGEIEKLYVSISDEVLECYSFNRFKKWFEEKTVEEIKTILILHKLQK